ncbi:hypothetical protein HYPSUDRAFT_45305 [Hypholoma sublateritium FD-334 SS-4]|uniref:Uncharacterized protein n=1 Tax=Hypholoma sublateritium (strain FD-334 SS-4) TaxID=945553 RepID=A0A0D2NHK3_HYPSF|nr:hypothetical protein HYPSUDRAFT_45305 [Hypholoma sublateritium FD-334 SS-4]
MESPLSNADSLSTTLSGAVSSSPPDRALSASQNQVPQQPPQGGTAAPDPSLYAQRSECLMKHAQSDEKSDDPERPIADIISEQFPTFDADAHVVSQFSEEAARDAKFEEELGTMLLNVVMKTHAWAASRPRHEAAVAGRTLEAEIAQIMQTEAEQEQTRQRLGEFVHRMKNALAALMGTL